MARLKDSVEKDKHDLQVRHSLRAMTARIDKLEAAEQPSEEVMTEVGAEKATEESVVAEGGGHQARGETKRKEKKIKKKSKKKKSRKIKLTKKRKRRRK